ncbi:hypothetical protein ON010_g6474 [Phytophthora cinnamomi]|nr:hypothetical protein ON010_g6474 [Phytophthora cinnamomi]
MATAREMWNSFERDKTKRAYASEIRLRRDLYAAKFTVGEDMEKYLERLEDMRRQLANMNAAISDADMVNVILQGVVDSHRNVVRMFNRNSNGGVTPDLATVKVKKNSGKKVSKETRKGFFCKNKGHLRADCFGWKALQEKKGSESEKRGDGNIGKVATPMKLVWAGQLGDSKNPPVPIRMMKSQHVTPPVVASVNDWMLDGGAGAHVCLREWRIGGLDTNELSGWVRLEIQPGKYLDLQGVRYAPNGAVNLISQRLLEKTRWKPSYFDTDNEQLRCKYFDKDGIRLVFKKKNDGFYWMKASPVLQTSMMIARSIETREDNIVMKWHLKLAHLNEEAMKKMVRDGLADGMDGMTMDDFKKTPLKCMACEEAKAKRMAFKRQVGKRASECGARLMSDVCYVGIATPGRAKYFQLVQDEASRYKWVFLLNKKSEAAENVIVLVRQLEKDYKVRLFSCDQGGEFLNDRLATFFREHGIRLLTTNAYTPEENCFVEKLNGKLLNKVRAICEAANLPACLWGEILHYVVHVDNMSATKALKNTTPFEKLWNKKPNMNDLKVCGCVAYYHVPKQKQVNKLEMRAKPALFLGMAESTLGYRLLDLETGEVLQRRSVTFREDVAVGGDYVERLLAKQYYGKVTTVPSKIPYVLMPVTRVAISDCPTEESTILKANIEAEAERPGSEIRDIEDDESVNSSDESDWDVVELSEADESHGGACGATEQRVIVSSGAGLNVEVQRGAVSSGSTTTSVPQVAGSNSVPVSGQGRSVATSGSTAPSAPSAANIASAGRRGSPSVRATTSGGSNRTSRNSTAPPTTGPRRSGRQRRANSWYNPNTWVMAVTLTQCMLIGVVNDILNPTTREAALKSEHAKGWQQAMDAEYEALIMNETWELVPRPPCRKGRRKPNILTSVWVLVAKRNEKGEVERLKARLDYLATYSPVVRIESGYEDGIDRVCRLRKGRYGLKQASKIWNDTLHKVLIKLGFVQCTYDAGVYWRRRAGRVVFLTIYVDDIVLAGVTSDIDKVVAELAAQFKLKDLGRVRHLLGMEVNYKPGKMVCLSQTAYIERLAEKFFLGSAKPVRSPQFHHERMSKIETDEANINDPKLPYREIVGSLQYLVVCTRPDLANAVRTLGRYTSAYTVENYRAAQRVVRYALATKKMGLVYRFTPGFPAMDAFCDADHQSCPGTSRSVTGYMLRLHGNMWM